MDRNVSSSKKHREIWYGNVDRKQKHTFLKKNVNNKSDSNNSNTNSDEDEQNSDKNEEFKYSKIKLNNKISQSTSRTAPKKSKMARSRSTQRDNKQNMNTTVLSQIENVIQEKGNVAEIIDSDEDSDNKYQFHKSSKQQLNYKVLILEKENKKLRLDNA